jgi:hypothetical protein
MQRDRVAGAACVALGAGMVANALLGPLGLGMIRIRQSAAMETQLLGGELTSLFLAGPMAIVAGIAWWRANRLAPILACGPAGYALYTYVQFVLVPDYTRYSGNNERWFPLYLTLVILAWTLLWRAWRGLADARIAPLDRALARPLGFAMLAIAGVFTLAWFGTIAAAFTAPPTAEYLEHPTAFWLVRLMDLGFVIPVGAITGLGLVRRTPWSTRAAYGFIGVEMLLTCAVAGMAIRMWMRDDPAASDALLGVSTLGAATFVVFYGLLVRAAVRFAPQRLIDLHGSAI